MDKRLTSQELKKGHETLRALLAMLGDKPFRRSDLAEKILARKRNARTARDRADEIAEVVMKEAAGAGWIARAGHVHWRRASAQRLLLNGTAVAELAEPIEVKIDTHVPEKWLFVDLETGEVWRAGPDGKFIRAAERVTDAICRAIR